MQKIKKVLKYLLSFSWCSCDFILSVLELDISTKRSRGYSDDFDVILDVTEEVFCDGNYDKHKKPEVGNNNNQCYSVGALTIECCLSFYIYARPLCDV